MQIIYKPHSYRRFPKTETSGCTHKDTGLYTNLRWIIYKPHSYRRFPKTETMNACMKKLI